MRNGKYLIRHLTRNDIVNIRVALQLRVEACVDNEEHKEAANWSSTVSKCRAFEESSIRGLPRGGSRPKRSKS